MFTTPGIEPRSPALQEDSLSAEPQGKPRNTGVGNPSLLQRIFPTQESNWGLLHCRLILYQLSYQGSPCIGIPADFVLDAGFISIYYMMKEGKREGERKEGRKEEKREGRGKKGRKKRKSLMEQL